MDIFFDTLFIVSKHENTNQLRIPLSCILDYKGFRCLAMGVVPVHSEYTLRLGLNSENKFKNDHKFMKILSIVGDILCLKEVKYIFQSRTVHDSIPISLYIKVFVYEKEK
jgi:hypothetical protein